MSFIGVLDLFIEMIPLFISEPRLEKSEALPRLTELIDVGLRNGLQSSSSEAKSIGIQIEFLKVSDFEVDIFLKCALVVKVQIMESYPFILISW